MLIVFAAFAVAAPPEGVDLDDLDTWEARAADALNGPAGCWVFEGDVAVTYTAWSAPSLFRRVEPEENRFAGTFTGRLAEGTWTSFVYDLARQSGASTELDMHIWPLVGKIDPSVPVRTDLDNDGDGDSDVEGSGKRERERSKVSVGADQSQALNLLHQAIERIGPATTTAMAEWREREGGVRVIQDVPLTDAARADTLTVSTLFPGGGAFATEVDVMFPRKLHKTYGLISVTAYDAQMHLRSRIVGERVVPAKESLSVGVGALGFTLGYEQQLSYRRATACTE